MWLVETPAASSHHRVLVLVGRETSSGEGRLLKSRLLRVKSRPLLLSGAWRKYRLTLETDTFLRVLIESVLLLLKYLVQLL